MELDFSWIDRIADRQGGYEPRTNGATKPQDAPQGSEAYYNQPKSEDATAGIQRGNEGIQRVAGRIGGEKQLQETYSDVLKIHIRFGRVPPMERDGAYWRDVYAELAGYSLAHGDGFTTDLLVAVVNELERRV